MWHGFNTWYVRTCLQFKNAINWRKIYSIRLYLVTSLRLQLFYKNGRNGRIRYKNIGVHVQIFYRLSKQYYRRRWLSGRTVFELQSRRKQRHLFLVNITVRSECFNSLIINLYPTVFSGIGFFSRSPLRLIRKQ